MQNIQDWIDFIIKENADCDSFLTQQLSFIMLIFFLVW